MQHETTAQRVLLGLGSNVGDRRDMLRRAVWLLAPDLSDVLLSNIYESPALLPEGAPAEWNIPFLNMCLSARTHLTPQALFERCKTVEAELGRQVRGYWGPREIDIDLLAYGQRVLNSPELTIPHPRLLERDFVLLPLCEIAGAWCYPVAGEHEGKSLEQIARRAAMAEKTTMTNLGAL